MVEVFKKYLQGLVNVTEHELDTILEVATIKKVKKWQSLLHDGEIWRNMCFVSSGCFRLYRYDMNGIDYTVRFAIENWWIIDPESYNHESPSQYNIEALAPGTVIIWTKLEWERLLSSIPTFKLFYDRLTSNAFETSQQRIFSLISKSAEERYLEFQNSYPKIFDKVPLHMVASYLGVSRETLSRVRKDFLKPKTSLPK